MKKVINSPQAPKAIGPYSQAIEGGGFIFTSGVLPESRRCSVKTRSKNDRFYDRFNFFCGNEQRVRFFL